MMIKRSIKILLICLAVFTISSCDRANKSNQGVQSENPTTSIVNNDLVSPTITVVPSEEIMPDSDTPTVVSSEETKPDSNTPTVFPTEEIKPNPDNQTVESTPEANESPIVATTPIEESWPIENDKQTTFGNVLIIGDSVNVHSEPSADTKIKGHAHKGQVLTLLQDNIENGFYLLSYGGNPSYINSDMCEVLSGTHAQVTSSSGEKLIALTFDDGPSGKLTPQLLDILKSEEISVTFFVTGTAAKANQSIVKRAEEEGHQIGSHTWSHKDLRTLSSVNLASEVDKAEDIIEQITGNKPSVTRPPYGEYNDAVIEAVGMPVIMWSIDPLDWKYRDADTVYQNVVNVARDGGIILLHDIHATSIQAAARIIPELKARGFTFVTVGELLERSGDSSGGVYTILRPYG